MNAEEIAAEIARLEERRGALSKEIVAVDDAIRSLRLDQIDLLYGLHVGSIVAHEGKRYLVCEIANETWRRPWVVGHPMKKDGTFGSARRNLFSDWEVV